MESFVSAIVTQNDKLALFPFLPPLLSLVLTLVFYKQNKLRNISVFLSSLMLPITTFYVISSMKNSGVYPSFHLSTILDGINIAFVIRGVRLIFGAAIAILYPIATLYTIGYLEATQDKNKSSFFVFFSLSILVTLGICYSSNLFTTLIFYELLTIATYFLVIHKKNEISRRAGRKYLSVLCFTSLIFFIPAMAIVYNYTGTLDFRPEGIFAGIDIPKNMVVILALLFLFGVSKSALMPVHSWLPAAMIAPTPVSALLHAVVVVKSGVFTIILIFYEIFGFELLKSSIFIRGQNILLLVISVTTITASVIAASHDNLKKRLAYSTISQLSYILMAVSFCSLNGLHGAMLHLFGHAFGKITLFFVAGSFYVKYNLTKVSKLKGIGEKMPISVLCFVIGCISIIGLPPTAGFISKYHIILGTFENKDIFSIIILIISTLLSVMYTLPIIYNAFFIKAADDALETPTKAKEAPLLMLLATIASTVIIILVFLYGDHVLNLMYIVK